MSQPSPKSRKRRLRVVGVVVGVMIALQCIPVNRANPPVKADLLASVKLDETATQALHAACYDCHSHETRWPFYARIAPVSWWVTRHVREGREHLNLSDWPPDRPWDTRARLEAMTHALRNDSMPLTDYRWLHTTARLSAADRTHLADALQAAADQLKPLPAH